VIGGDRRLDLMHIPLLRETGMANQPRVPSAVKLTRAQSADRIFKLNDRHVVAAPGVSDRVHRLVNIPDEVHQEHDCLLPDFMRL
jgi:hypothetical protein